MIANQKVPDDIRPKVAPSDLVQQSLAEAWEKFDMFRGHDEQELRAWLRRVLLNNIRDSTRAFRDTIKRNVACEVPIAPTGSQDNSGQYLVSEETSPSGCAMENENLERLLAAIDELPSHYAEIIRLRNIEYLSFIEIGELIDVSQDAARKLWKRALQRLTADLGSRHDQS